MTTMCNACPTIRREWRDVREAESTTRKHEHTISLQHMGGSEFSNSIKHSTQARSLFYRWYSAFASSEGVAQAESPFQRPPSHHSKQKRNVCSSRYGMRLHKGRCVHINMNNNSDKFIRAAQELRLELSASADQPDASSDEH